MCDKKWRQKLSVALAVILAGGLFAPATALAAVEKQPQIVQEEPVNEAAEIVEAESVAREDVTTLEIPEGTVRIEPGAYSDRQDILEVIIPEGVKSIGAEAFSGCNNLVKVVLPESLEVIERGAFYFCYNLKTINIPKNVAVLPKQVFFSCRSLKNIEIPEGVTDIEEEAFQFCESLESATLAATVKNIGRNAFYGCASLKAIAIPEGVTDIMPETFYQCYKLESVSLPKSLTAIQQYAFYDCDCLSGISFKENLSEIGNFAFFSCGALENVFLPKSVVTIGDAAFRNCDKLQNFTIAQDSALEWIGDDAFGYCPQLKEFILPQGVVHIGRSAFYECAGLSHMVIPGSVNAVSASMFGYCGNLKSVVLQNGVRSIETGAFSGCKELLYVAVPESVLLLQPSAITNNYENLVMLAPQGSYGEDYARDNGIPYQYYSGDQEESLINCAEDLSELSVAAETTNDLALPATGARHASVIGWESGNSAVISIEESAADQPVKAIVHRGKESAEVTLTASATHGPITLTRKFTVTVKDDLEGSIVREDSQALTIPKTTDRNLDLPTWGSAGSEIVWSSDNPQALASDGTVKRGLKDVSVTLTAKISYGSATVQKTFTVKVLKDLNQIKAQGTKALNSIQVPAAKTLYTGSVDHATTISPTYPKSFAATLGAAGLSRKSVSYRSDQPQTAHVSAQGKVTGLKAGKAVIATTVTLNNGQKKVWKTAITVKKPYLKISGKTAVKKGKTIALKAQRYGIAKKAACVWSVDKTKLASINKKTGKLKAKKPGTVKVTVKVGKVKASYKVRVKK